MDSIIKLSFFCIPLSVSLLILETTSSYAVDLAHCGEYSTLSSCPIVRANPNEIIGDLSAEGHLDGQLRDWYTDIELFESYIRWIDNEGAQNMIRIWASGILGAIEYGFFGNYQHEQACAIIDINPVDAYSYVYRSAC